MDHLFSGEMMVALCRTLVHSLWQGMLLALVAGLTLWLSRKKTAAFRYNLMAVQFVLFLGATGVTFYLEWLAATVGPDIRIVLDPVSAANGGNNGAAVAETAFTGWRSTVQWWQREADLFLNRYAFMMVLLWSVFLCWRTLQMVSGMRYLHQLRHHRNRLAPTAWQNRLTHLAGRFHISQHIRLLESEMITVPMVVGFWAPVILVPVGLMANLPAGQIEAILLHELAHIRRKDFIFNWLQCFAETIFFFNPAVLWVSTLIRDERENCCDDMAVSVLENKTHYIKALVAFQEFNLQAASYATAFAGRKYTLLDRVKRIIHHHHTKTLSIMEKISLVVSLLIVGAIAFFPACQTFAQNPPQQELANFRTINVDGEGSTTNPMTVYVRDKKGKTYQYKKIENRITEMYVDMEKVPEEKWADYNWVVQAVDQQIAEDMAQAEADRAQAEIDMAQAQIDMEQAQRDMEQAIRDQEQALKEMQEDMRQTQLEAQRDMEVAANEQAMAVKAMQDAEVEHKQAMAQMARDMEQANRDIEQAKRDMAQAKIEMELAQKEMQLAQKTAEADRKMVQNLKSDIVNDGLAKNQSAIHSIRLSDSGMEVNGKAVPAEQHQRYKNKYLKSPGQQIRYGQ